MKKIILNFSLDQIAASGQCFRMTPCAGEPGTYIVISGSHFLKIRQRGNEFNFLCSYEETPFWERYFDLGTDYASFIRSIDCGDRYLQKAAEFGNGIRILRQDPWEMIITFVISQQKAIPSIRRLVEELCTRYGAELPASNLSPGRYFSFPSPAQLNRASLEDLQALKLGYRAKYIKRLCEDACSGALDLERLKRLSYPDAMDYLQGFFGIGEKVANCVCLFGLHHIDAFPVDTWIKKILLREYAHDSLPGTTRKAGTGGGVDVNLSSDQVRRSPQSRIYETLVQKHFFKYHGCAGVMQQYIFYYERVIVNKKPGF